ADRMRRLSAPLVNKSVVVILVILLYDFNFYTKVGNKLVY
ncbi:hypothetical protein M2448_002022, partial [Dysgonomonas sp. PF1-14]|nr:hypothetical protein [Dysgonomonas sp. PF1-14]